MPFAFVTAVVLFLAAVPLPDVTKGVIGGKVAVVIWPRVGGEPVEPAGCASHLVPVTEADSELLFPCGKWFQPPPGTYRVWLQQSDLISPFPNILTYAGGPFRGRGLAAMFDLVAAGRVQLSSKIPVREQDQFRVLHLESHLRLGTLGRAFERRISGSMAHEPVLMPTGRVIAAITDRRGDAVAVSRPVVVSGGKIVSVSPEPPPKGSDVLVVLTRARTASTEMPDEIQMTLEFDRKSIPPDVVVSTADRYFGVWYAIEAPHAVFRVASATMLLPDETIKLRAGAVSTLRRTLKTLPSAEVSIVAPPGALDEATRSIEIIAPGQRAIRRVALVGEHSLQEYLPAEKLQVVLQIGQWRFRREVDLTDFENHQVTFELDPIVFSGSVYRGRAPVASTVKFYVGHDETVTAETDDRGQFEITLWEPRLYVVEVAVHGDRAPPYREYFVEILQSGSRDFHIPDSRSAVHVMDVDSGKPVAGAEVVATNRFRIGDGPEQTTSQGSISEADGVAVLPPLRTGSVRLVGRARGYIESEPLVLPVDEEQGLESAVIQLRAEPEGDQLLCRLWDGRPAVNALVIAVASDLSDIILWRSSTDADGGVRVPSTLSGAVLLISHEHAAGLARPWTRPNHDETVTWNLSPPAPPIAVRVTDAFDRPVRMAHMVLWVDGIPLRGMALRFLSGTAPLSDGDGFWHATNLGGQTYRALATRTFLLPIPETLAQTILYQASNDIPTRLIVLP